MDQGGITPETSKPKRRLPFCSVSICNSTEPRCYHRFPKDLYLQELWIRACNSKKKISLSTARICQYHFLPNDYCRDLRNELMGLPIRMKLKENAVPTQSLSLSHVWIEHDYCKSIESPEGCSLNHEEGLNIAPSIVKKECTPGLDKLKISLVEIPSNQSAQMEEIKYFQVLKDTPGSFSMDRQNGEERYDVLSRKLHSHEEKYKKLMYEFKQLKRKSSHLRRELKRQKEKTISKQCSIKQVKSYLKDFLPRSQINFIFKKSSQPGHWEENEILHSFLLHRISSKAYNYLNQNKLMALPGCSTLRKWIKNFECNLGIQKASLNKLSFALRNNIDKPNFNLCSLIFDSYKFDAKNKNFGPFKQLQVAMISSISHQWELPIFLDLECPVTKLLVMRIIHAVEEKGAIITSVTCRSGPSYHRLMCELGFSSEKPYFTFSKDASRKIFVFANPIHSVQMFSNYILQTGFELPDKSILTKDLFHPLLQNFDISTNQFQLKNEEDEEMEEGDDEDEEHEGISQFEATEVQLFSHEAAELIVNQFPDQVNISVFVELMANWLNIFNSSASWDSDKYKCAFGVHEKEQFRIIRSVIKKMGGIRQPGTKHLLQCQLSIIITSHALIQLYEHLKSQFSLECILTSQLTLQSIGNIFSKFKDFDTKGLSPLSLLKRIRLTIVGEDNTTEGEEEEDTKNGVEVDGIFLRSGIDDSVSDIQESVNVILASSVECIGTSD
ncbi:transposable element P transposase isoform X1 [Lepeophtheirus salmonis]|nr:uncharacterized protein LOC121118811 [Lepeophtheirus salmonis]